MRNRPLYQVVLNPFEPPSKIGINGSKDSKVRVATVFWFTFLALSYTIGLTGSYHPPNRWILVAAPLIPFWFLDRLVSGGATPWRVFPISTIPSFMLLTISAVALRNNFSWLVVFSICMGVTNGLLVRFCLYVAHANS